MKIVNFNESLNRYAVANDAYKICVNAQFPVTYDDVYAHLFSSDKLIIKLLIDNKLSISGFAVFELFEEYFKDRLISMLYLSGMVINPIYQGHNLSSKIIKTTYSEYNTDLISLRTQNIAMLKSLVNCFDSLLTIPGSYNKELIEYLRMIEPFKNIDNNGIICNCYETQLYNNLIPIQTLYGLTINSKDAVGVVTEPKKEKKLSLFNN